MEFTTAKVTVGDSVYIQAGEDDVTPKEYFIKSRTDDNNIVLTAAASTSQEQVTYYTQTGNQTVLAYLYDGEESGLLEMLSLLKLGTAVQAMVGGMTLFMGGVTIGTADVTSVLADHLIGDCKYKWFELHGTLTDKNFVVTVTTGIILGADTTLSTLDFDDDAEKVLLEWRAYEWKNIAFDGVTEGA